MRTVSALSLDLDDTLRDSSGAAEALHRTAEVLAPLSSGIAPNDILAANALEWTRLWPEVEGAWTLGGMTGEAVTTEAWRRTLKALGIGDVELVRRATDTHLAETLRAQRIFDDAARLLDDIDGRVPAAVVTNGASDTQRAVLRALDLERRLGAAIISGEVGLAKPDAAIFALACEELGSEPTTTWHVGDSLVTDVAGARAAGLVAVWLNRDGSERAENAVVPDLTIGSLDDLRAVIVSAVPSESETSTP